MPAPPCRTRHALLACLLMLPLATTAAEPSWRVYVSNEASGDLSVIDPETRAETQRVVLGKRPRGLVASPDGRTLYIALSGSPAGGPNVDESKLPPPDKRADGIAEVDTATLTVRRIHRGVSDPEQVVVSPDGARLYVASEDTGQLVVMDARGGSVIASIAVGGEPEGVAVSPDGATVLVTSEADNAVAIVDARTLAVTASVKAGARPRNAVFTRDGKRAFVSGETDASVNVIDIAARTLARRATLGDASVRPMGVVLSPAEDRVFLTTGRGGTLAALDANTLANARSVAVGPRPWGLAISPDGAQLYTANGASNDVSVVDAATLTVVARVKVGERPWGVAVATLPR